MPLLRRLLETFAVWWPAPRVIQDRRGAGPYLSRWYLVGTPPSINDHGDPTPDHERNQDAWQLYLHRFHRGDDDAALHNHPWRWAVSWILVGGYTEERRVRDGVPFLTDIFGSHQATEPEYAIDSVERTVVRPGTLNVLLADTFHRVDLLDGEAWSLFLVGPKIASWGFWDRTTNLYTPWRTFIERLRRTL